MMERVAPVVPSPLSSTPTGAPISTRRAWLLAVRPRTLPAAVAPVAVGTALAITADGFHALAALGCVAVALLLQIASNLANDAFDFKRGADTEARVGPTRVTAAGLIPPRRVFQATGVVLALAMIVGLALVARGGWPLLVLGALALISAVAYTGGPLPLGYLGLGDFFVFAFFGLVAVAGTAYVQVGHLSGDMLVAAVPIGCLATAILVVNNLRDADTDRVAGKRTLAVRLGPSGAKAEYLILLTVAYLTPFLMWLVGDLSGWFWLPWLSVPLAVPLVRGVSSETGRALNRRLADTARLLLMFALLFSVAIVL